MGGAGWAAMRSFTRDSSVTQRRISRQTLRRIWGFARPYARQLGLLVVLVSLGAGVTVAVPLLLKAIIDQGVVPDSPVTHPQLITWLALAVAAFAVLEAVLTLAERWYSARVGESVIYDLRARVFDHVQRMPVAFFTRTQTGSLVNRLNTDVIGAQRALTTTLTSVISNIIGLVVVLATMVYLSWQITLIVLGLIPLFLLPAKWVGRRMQRITRESMQLDADMSATMTERFNVGGSTLVKLFGRLDEESETFARRAARVRDIGIVQAMYSRVFFTGLTLLAALATALVYGIGGHLVVGGALQLGTLVALSTLLGRLYGPLTSLSNVHVDVMTALVSFDRVFEILDLRPMIEDKPDAIALPEGAATVDFDDVWFHYPRPEEVSLASLESNGSSGGAAAGSSSVASAGSSSATTSGSSSAVLDGAGGATPGTTTEGTTTRDRATEDVLRGVSFTAEPGQLVALVGPSGAGKTTITNLVTRLYDVTGGAVGIGGHDLRDVTMDSLRGAVGMVTQDPHMFHDTIRANLLYARPSATEDEVLRACEAAQIADLVAALPDGLDTLVGERGYRLSGGEKQRLALARLLLKAPAVVVLDEATAHLDSESEKAVQRALRTALRGRTSLVIAHRLSTIQEADQILVVDRGRIVERGRHEELLAGGGLYAELYRTQFSREQETATNGSTGTPTRMRGVARR